MNYSPSLSLEVKQISLASSLFDGIEDNDIFQIKHLLEVKHASPNFVIPDKGMSAMHLVAGSKPESFVLDVMRLFLLHDGDPNVRSYDGMTPVHVAAAWGQRSLLQLLLTSGGDPELCDDEGLTPLDYAERENHSHVVEMLSQFVVAHDTRQDEHNVTLQLERLLLEEEDFGAEFVVDADEDMLPAGNQLVLHREMLASLDDRDDDASWQRVQRWCEQQSEQTAQTSTQYHSAANPLNNVQSSTQYHSATNPLNASQSPIQYHTASLQSNTYPSFHTPNLSPRVLSTGNCPLKHMGKSAGVARKLPVDLSFSSDSDCAVNIRDVDTWEKIKENSAMDNVHLLNSVQQERDGNPNIKASHMHDCVNIHHSYAILSSNTVKVNTPKNIQSKTVVQEPSNGDILRENGTTPKTHPLKETSHLPSVQSKSSGCSDGEIVLSKCTPKSMMDPKALLRYPIGFILEHSDVYESPKNSYAHTLEEFKVKKVKVPTIHIINSTLNEHKPCAVQEKNTISQKSWFHPSYTAQVGCSLNKPSSIEKKSSHTDSYSASKPQHNVCHQSSGSDSDAFFTCGSHKQTVSSRSAVSSLYKYTDRDHDIVLIEKRMPTSSCASVTEVSESEKEAHARLSSQQGSVSTIPSDLGYCTEALRRELQLRGYPIGPITSSTKRVYLRKLSRLRRGQPVPPHSPGKLRYSRELERTTRDVKLLDTHTGSALEQRMSQQFSNPAPGRRWREGVIKCSFTYLLLDPRVTCNLPLRSSSLSLGQCWLTFLHSVFYVGKGKRARPYSHLYQAVEVWKNNSSKRDKKTERILDIWGTGHGVVCLHVFQSIIPVEAYTREAAMIDALGLENVCNLKRGEYYGDMACKTPEQRRILGVYLLFRAMHVLLHEGERQLQPLDIV